MISVRVVALILILCIGCFVVVRTQHFKPIKCGPNQHYEKCAPKLSCQPSCNNAKEKNFCYHRCEPGCVCNGKRLRNNKKECVLPKDCSRQRQPYPSSQPRIKYPTQPRPRPVPYPDF